jgi:hypothetical protein
MVYINLLIFKKKISEPEHGRSLYGRLCARMQLKARNHKLEITVDGMIILKWIWEYKLDCFGSGYDQVS